MSRRSITFAVFLACAATTVRAEESRNLMDLVQSEMVDYAVAKAAATNPNDFELKMNMLSGRGGGGGGGGGGGMTSGYEF